MDLLSGSTGQLPGVVDENRSGRPSRTSEPTRGRRDPATDGRLADSTRSAVDWPTLVWLVVLHGGALAAPFYFTWQALALTVFLHWLTGGIGICLGFHRYFTHSSFQAVKPVRWTLAFLGGLAGEGSAIDWVANHRKHHANSDQEGDPHSPLNGAWWSHMLWLGWQYPKDVHKVHIDHWAPDMERDGFLQFMKTTFLFWHFVLAAAPYGIGNWMGGQPMAISFVIWGMFVRLCFVLHATWFVNSASHIWGYRNYVTTDKSTNNWWVALLTYGEGWHNNHHAFPRMAAHGHRWWEIDMTFMVIRLMQYCGLAWDVVDYKRRADKADGHAKGAKKSKGQKRRQAASSR